MLSWAGFCESILRSLIVGERRSVLDVSVCWKRIGHGKVSEVAMCLGSSHPAFHFGHVAFQERATRQTKLWTNSWRPSSYDSPYTRYSTHITAHSAITMQALRTAMRAPSARAFSTSAPKSLAKMQLIGRLADTPEVMPTSTGRELIRYAVGVSAGRKDESGNRPVSWFKVASFSEGPQRDLLLSLPKG